VGPGLPFLAVIHRHATFGAKPDLPIRPHPETVHPFVDQLLDIGAELSGFYIEKIGARPGADPKIAVLVVGKGIYPVVGKAVHRKIGLPFSILEPRGTTRIGTEPGIALRVLAESENVLVGQPVISGECALGRRGLEVNLHGADRRSDPKRIT